LPPIIDTPATPTSIKKNKIVVYLPFEDQQQVIQLLAPFTDFEFHIYAPEVVTSAFAHVTCNPLSREGFQKDLYDCAGIISNAGFELASECLQLGKKILAKPLHAQMEQISNASALKQLGYGHTMNDLDSKVIGHWLQSNSAVQITYPNIAKVLVKWIQDGMPEMDNDFVASIWQSVDVFQVHQ